MHGQFNLVYIICIPLVSTSNGLLKEGVRIKWGNVDKIPKRVLEWVWPSINGVSFFYFFLVYTQDPILSPKINSSLLQVCPLLSGTLIRDQGFEKDVISMDFVIVNFIVGTFISKIGALFSCCIILSLSFLCSCNF